jgi:hypothetical protein
MTMWIERYRLRAEERFRRLEDVLAADAAATDDTTPTKEQAS